MRTLILAAALAASLSGASAQTYPARPITMIVPFAAGGPTDRIARIVAEGMRPTLGQPIVIEDVSGASGTIGVGRAVRAAPDGYTLSGGMWATHVLNGAVFALPYDLLTDLEPIALLTSNPQLIVARNGVPANNLKELIAWLKANPGKASQGTAGAGTRVAGAFFQTLSGTTFAFVPYRGSAPAMQDLIGGQIDLMFDQVSNSLAQVRAGNIKGFAVTAKTRLGLAPEIPSVDEAGLPGFYTSLWNAIWAPKSTPKEIIAKLHAAVVASLADPTVRAKLIELGQEIPPPEQQTPQALGAYQKAEIEKWWPIIKAAGITPDN
jgi:tripartite-type tricarboxylate transporter receptor subunit TctC